MEITDDYLTINEFSRSGKKLKECRAIVLHWTAVVGQTPQQTRNYYESLKNGSNGYASAHAIIGDTQVVHAIPWDEVAFHCGTSRVDPACGRVYTDNARVLFGNYCVNWQTTSPNNCSIGLEIEPLDLQGHFSFDTWATTKELVVQLIETYNVPIENITYHSNIIGTSWKTCPKLFVDHPEEFQRFLTEVQSML